MWVKMEVINKKPTATVQEIAHRFNCNLVSLMTSV